MNVKILFNGEGLNADLSCGWGLSILIDNRILFDTGENAEGLDNNIDRLKVDYSLIEAVVISHDHWDHTGGLWSIIDKNFRLRIYGCPGFGKEFKEKISESSVKYFESSHFERITNGIYSTGEIIGLYKGNHLSEQALIIKTEKGFSVITGCAHPGIIKILEKAKAQLSIKSFYTVCGGFHLKGHSIKELEKIVEKFKEFKVKRVGATHCSGTNAEKFFREAYEDQFLTMKVGESFTV